MTTAFKTASEAREAATLLIQELIKVDAPLEGRHFDLYRDADGVKIYLRTQTATETTLTAAPRKGLVRDAARAVARSWKDPAVAAARVQRHSVIVTDKAGTETAYPSVRAAFRALNLKMSQRQTFRKRLKAAGTAEAYGYIWKAIPVGEEN